MQIHPTAVVEDGARLGEGCIIHAYAVITRYCELAAGVNVHPFAVIGGDPQDLGFKAATESGVRIGAGTVIREHVTVNRATKAGGATVIGADCFLMAASHVAHDCQVGDRVVVANAVLLAGHVHVGDRVFLGGGVGVHQFCRVGESAMISGGARISLDIPPFTLAAERNTLVGLNLVGLRRRGFKRDVLGELKRAFREVNASVGDQREIAAAALERGDYASAEARQFLEFYSGGRRGFVRPIRAADGDDAEPADY